MVILVKSKNAERFYEVKETVEAGILLVGTEVKSLRNNQGSLEGAHISISKVPEMWLVGAFIPPYQPSNTLKSYNPNRKRKLLVTKKELEKLVVERKSGSLTLLPLMVYLDRNRMRLRIGLCKKKKLFDKRQSLRKKEDKRSIKDVY